MITNRRAFQILAKRMDERDVAFRLIEKKILAGEKVPNDQVVKYAEWRKKPDWRKDFGVMRKIKMAARRMAKNENNSRVK